MTSAVKQLIETRDLLGFGDTSADTMALGYGLTRGMAFPYPAGVVVLRRKKLYPVPETYWHFVGLARLGDTTIDTGDLVAHDADQAYVYSAANVLGNGFASVWSNPIRLDFDNGSNLIQPLMPMYPIDLAALPQGGGTFEVVWSYGPSGQGAYPTDFQVFEGVDAASVDYNTPLGTIPYEIDQHRFTFTTGAYGNGTTHVFAVRARNASGVAEQNTFTTSEVVAMAAGPTAATIIGTGQRS